MKAASPINMHLDLSVFKTQPCKDNSPHEIKKCIFYHFKSEKRRSLTRYVYSKTLCTKKQKCTSDACAYAHNFIEQIYHPDNYKKKYCKDFIEKGNCKFGIYCALAHSDMELKIKPLHLMRIDRDFLLFHFKSEFCPFSKIEHDRFKCVYAHNWQDYKRPYSIGLKPVPCKNWDKEKEIVVYEEGCAQGNNCEYCHGWKECEYHYLNFKKYDCKKGALCERKEVCSFKHNESEGNDTTDIEDEFFVPVMKNEPLNQDSPAEYLQLIEIRLPVVEEEPKKAVKHYDKIAEMNRQKRLMRNGNRELDLSGKHKRGVNSARQLPVEKNQFYNYPSKKQDRDISPISREGRSFIEGDDRFSSAILPQEDFEDFEDKRLKPKNGKKKTKEDSVSSGDVKIRYDE